MPTSARDHISFGLFRANQTGTESWQRLTTERFLSDLDGHLDQLLSEYVTMLSTCIELVKAITDGAVDKQGVADTIRARFPFEELEPLDDCRHEVEDGPIFADERFQGWRDLEHDALVALCREHFQALLDEHRHLEGTLARTYNRIRDIEGWGHWRTEGIKSFLYGQLMWDWPKPEAA